MRRSAWKPALLSAVAVLGIAGLTRAPYTPPGTDAALLRFSWRLSTASRENCRPRTQEELDALPVHMRTPEVCTRDASTFTLITRIDDAAPDTAHLTRGGAKGDRPLFVLQDRALEPGRHRLRVELRRDTAAPGADAAARSTTGGAEGSELLATLDTTVDLVRGRVRLVTMDGDGGRLEVRSSVRR
jgi:hypothetical protein